MAEEATEAELVRPNIDVEQERKKPRLEALLFCHYAAIDERGKATIAGCFDRLKVNPETKNSGSFYIAIRTGETRKGRINVSIISPANDLLGNLFYDADIDRPLDVPSHIQFMDAISFQAEREGVYWVDVSFNGESLGGTSLTVEYRSPGEQKADTEE